MTVAEVFFPDMAIMFTHMAGQIPTTFGQEIDITHPIPAAPVAVAEVAVPAPAPVPAEDAPDAVRRTVTEQILIRHMRRITPCRKNEHSGRPSRAAGDTAPYKF